ncbi:MAG TPA: hypothetical protein VMS75_09260 [Terriglobales bacterium]|nr:hypothetical protein [Terriglobales bacterium]
MTKMEDRARRLQKWILIEAYKNGQALKSGERAARELGMDECEGYSIRRHDIYLRYFRLPVDVLPREGQAGSSRRRHTNLRLRSAAVLCEAMRCLLNAGLIQFPEGSATAKSQAQLLRIHASFIFLSEAGVRKAESLVSALQDPKRPDRLDKAWVRPSPLELGDAVPLSS